MSMLLVSVFIFVIVVISRLILNLFRLNKTKMYLREYMNWLNSGEARIDLMEHQHMVTTLVNKAGKGDIRVPVSQAMGYGQIANFKADPFAAFPNRLESVAHITIQTLKSCIGIYRFRCFESFNPIYWLGLIVFLPRSILLYLGVESKSIVTKVFNLLWWAGTTITSGVLIKENSKAINSYILTFIN
ncbi:hypothetical protein [Paenibacillus spongiae]|uniref:Uncharacterized protein n=1 Tax=Paenibacillus spongiae TaxID=2909671 RepID=A0ABY5SDM4_9BACL|nr:hypothetical protein [Paenibacillus spongiae]UVI32064.1 hypothetical protein L1F29_09705 [Paenibacillus spongiae]